MSRVIKFRAYKPHNSLRMKPGIYQVNEIVWYDEPFQGHTGEIFYKGYKTSDYLEDVKLMQFTGLTDKDGVEIYEGDIVKTTYRSKDYRLKNGKRKIISEPIKVVKWVENAQFTGFNVSLRSTDTWEVIGNIYENPDLLSPDKDKP